MEDSRFRCDQQTIPMDPLLAMFSVQVKRFEKNTPHAQSLLEYTENDRTLRRVRGMQSYNTSSLAGFVQYTIKSVTPRT